MLCIENKNFNVAEKAFMPFHSDCPLVHLTVAATFVSVCALASHVQFLSHYKKIATLNLNK
jgi:hypothetical protein